MKFLLTTLTIIISLQSVVFATLSVVDVGLMRINLRNAVRDFGEQVLQEENQQTMISQVDEYLEILGDPSKVNLDQIEEILSFLNNLGISLKSEDVIRDLDESEIHRQRPGSVYQPVAKDIIVDGKKVGEIDSSVFRGEVAMGRSIEHYRSVRSVVLDERAAIEKEIAEALIRVERAETASEVQKLSVLITSLEAKLGATDREISMASDELVSRWAELQLEEKTKAKAKQQRDLAAVKVHTERNIVFFQLPSEPLKFKAQ